MSKPDDIPQDIWEQAISIAARATIGWRGSGENSVVNMTTVIARAILAERLSKPCTCHPSDNPPVPCARKYALHECLGARA